MGNLKQRIVLLPLQGEPGPPGMRVQGPQVSHQPYLCLPAPSNNTSTSQLPIPIHPENRALPAPNAQGHSSGTELRSSLSFASVGDLGFDPLLSDPQGLFGVLF